MGKNITGIDFLLSKCCCRPSGDFIIINRAVKTSETNC